MQHGFNAYASAARTNQAIDTPRELEASLLLKAATRIQMIADDWLAREPDLHEALNYNRKLWMLLVSAVIKEDNPLPVAIKRNILSLAEFIFNHGIRVAAAPAPEKLAVLVNINRDIAAGLRGR